MLVPHPAMKTALLASLLLVASAALRAERVLIDFGASATPTEDNATATWNNIDEKNQHRLTNLNLIDAKGGKSGLLLSVVAPFNGANSNGVKTEAAGYPASAVADSLYANVEPFGGKENVRPVLKLSGLKPGVRYVLTFFASRLGAGGDNRTTRYTLEGAETSFVELNAANNNSRSVSTPPLVSAPDGTLLIRITPGPDNNNANHFTYLGVLEIKPAP